MSSPSTSAVSQSTLRQRRLEERERTSSETTITSGGEQDDPKRDEVVWGKTPGGEGTWPYALDGTTQSLGGGFYIAPEERGHLLREYVDMASFSSPT